MSNVDICRGTELRTAEHVAHREILKERVIDYFTNHDCLVHLIGSLSDNKGDAFSDIDVWVEMPDQSASSLIQDRQAHFNKVGPVQLIWERPRFAPINGMHSIVLYDSAQMPLEVDVYAASTTDSRPYATFIDRSRPNPADFEWTEGEDDASIPAKLGYIGLVTFWATKYLWRGETDKIDWAIQRYNGLRLALPVLPEINTETPPLGTLAEIASGLIEGAKEYNVDATALRSIAKAVNAAHKSNITNGHHLLS